MIKSKKFSKILVSLILILVTSFGVLFVAMQVNKTNTDTILSVSAVSDTTENNLSFNKNYDIIIQQTSKTPEKPSKSGVFGGFFYFVLLTSY